NPIRYVIDRKRLFAARHCHDLCVMRCLNRGFQLAVPAGTLCRARPAEEGQKALGNIMIFSENTALATQIIDLKRKEFLNKGVTKSQRSKYCYTSSSSWHLACRQAGCLLRGVRIVPAKSCTFSCLFPWIDQYHDIS
ncbi:hypothetical protein, partial [Caballeronia glebae]|uniref:hypothetical protein n=1 Tax=Caballeronia glebae TaxID=1777143 RepID=UPI001F472C99